MTEDTQNWVSLAIALSGTLATTIAAISAMASYLKHAKQEHERQLDEAITEAKSEVARHAKHERDISEMRQTMVTVVQQLTEFKSETREALKEIFNRINHKGNGT